MRCCWQVLDLAPQRVCHLSVCQQIIHSLDLQCFMISRACIHKQKSVTIELYTSRVGVRTLQQLACVHLHLVKLPDG